MATYLIKTTETYRADTEQEAKDLIEKAKAEKNYYIVTKSSSEIKTTKVKGEIVDEWRRVSITKEFTEEKEPTDSVIISYNIGDMSYENQETE